jgi:hypothetical protein
MQGFACGEYLHLLAYQSTLGVENLHKDYVVRLCNCGNITNSPLIIGDIRKT